MEASPVFTDSLSGTKSFQNLKAFAGEAQANRQYLHFAHKLPEEVCKWFRAGWSGRLGKEVGVPIGVDGLVRLKATFELYS